MNQRPAASRRRRETVSSVTAASRIAPVMMYWVDALEPRSERPLAIVMIPAGPPPTFREPAPPNDRLSTQTPLRLSRGVFSLVDNAGDQILAPHDLHRPAPDPDVVASLDREEDLVAELDALRVGADRGDDPAPAAGVGAGRDDQAAAGPALAPVEGSSTLSLQ